MILDFRTNGLKITYPCLMCQGTPSPPMPFIKSRTKDQIKFDTFDGAKLRFLKCGKKRRFLRHAQDAEFIEIQYQP
jgi:hypothetical protein